MWLAASNHGRTSCWRFARSASSRVRACVAGAGRISHVDEARVDGEALSVDHGGRRRNGHRGPDGLDQPVAHHDGARLDRGAGRRDDAGACDGVLVRRLGAQRPAAPAGQDERDRRGERQQRNPQCRRHRTAPGSSGVGRATFDVRIHGGSYFRLA
jgi:hypothetical protein